MAATFGSHPGAPTGPRMSHLVSCRRPDPFGSPGGAVRSLFLVVTLLLPTLSTCSGRASDPAAGTTTTPSPPSFRTDPELRGLAVRLTDETADDEAPERPPVAR